MIATMGASLTETLTNNEQMNLSQPGRAHVEWGVLPFRMANTTFRHRLGSHLDENRQKLAAFDVRDGRNVHRQKIRIVRNEETDSPRP